MKRLFYKRALLAFCHRNFQSVKICQFQCILRYFINGSVSCKCCYRKKLQFVLMCRRISQRNAVINSRIAVHNNLDSISHMFTSVKTLSPIYSITEFPLFTCSKYNRVGKRCKDIQKVRLKCGISIPLRCISMSGVRPIQVCRKPSLCASTTLGFLHTCALQTGTQKAPLPGLAEG